MQCGTLRTKRSPSPYENAFIAHQNKSIKTDELPESLSAGATGRTLVNLPTRFYHYKTKVSPVNISALQSIMFSTTGGQNVASAASGLQVRSSSRGSPYSAQWVILPLSSAWKKLSRNIFKLKSAICLKPVFG